MLAWAFLTWALLPCVAAQASGDLDLQLEAIEAHFNQSQIVPDFLPDFNPTGVLDADFSGIGDIDPGANFSTQQVAQTPALSVQSSGPLEGSYVLAMMDAGPPGANLSAGTNRHWLLYNVTILQNSTVNRVPATAITPYTGPNPPAGSGPHRYVILIYEQTSDFRRLPEFSRPGLPVAPMNWIKFVIDSRLGSLVAATYIQVEVGAASAAIASTAPVITSTLDPASTTASNASVITSTLAPASTTASSSVPSNSTGANNNNTNRALGLGIDISVIVFTAIAACLLDQFGLRNLLY